MACNHKSVLKDLFLYGYCLECKNDKIERRRAKGRRHYENHKEKVLAKCAEYRKNNPQKIKEMRVKYSEKLKSLRLVESKFSTPQLRYAAKLRRLIHQLYEIDRKNHKYFTIEKCRGL